MWMIVSTTKPLTFNQANFDKNIYNIFRKIMDF